MEILAKNQRGLGIKIKKRNKSMPLKSLHAKIEKRMKLINNSRRAINYLLILL